MPPSLSVTAPPEPAPAADGRLAARAALRAHLQTALAAGVTIVLWASAFPGIRAGLAAYDPRHLVTLRFVVASAVLAVVAAVMKVRVPARRDLPRIFLLGLIGIAGYNLALTYGETHVPAASASVLVNTAPLFTALLAAAFLGERLTRRAVAGLALAFTGAVLVSVRGESLSMSVWAWLVLLAAVFQATSFALQKALYARYSPIELTCYAIWSGTLVNLVWLPGLGTAVERAPRAATAAIVYLGIGPAALSYLAWAFVLRRLPAGRATSLLYAVPLFASVIAWVWLAEVPTVMTVVGGAVTLVGVMLVNTRPRAVAGDDR